MARSSKQPKEVRRCGECAHATPVYEPFNLLSLKGEPTLVHCPFEVYKQLINGRACELHFKPKIQ